MKSKMIVASLDVAGDVLAGMVPSGVLCPVDTFIFERAIERFSPGIVVTDAGASDRSDDAELFGKVSKFCGQVLLRFKES